MPVTEDRPAPYAPPSAIIDFVSRYRHRNVPFPVTADVLARIGVSQSLIPRTLQALQTLDLINEIGNPTETLEGIRLAPEAEYKKRLSRLAGKHLRRAFLLLLILPKMMQSAFVTPSVAIIPSVSKTVWSPSLRGYAPKRASFRQKDNSAACSSHPSA